MDRHRVMGRSGNSSVAADDEPVIWHVCWQAAIGRSPFLEPALYTRVRTRLLDAHRTGDRALLGFLVLPDEIHVLSRLPRGEPAGSLARGIGNIVARWVRELQAVRSPVFAGPHRAARIASAESVGFEMRMLAWRPVIKGLCRTPSHYRHASLRAALGLTPADGYDARPLLRLFGEAVQPARARLRSVLAKRPLDSEVRGWELGRGLALVTGMAGSERPRSREVKGAAAALVAASGSGSIDGALNLLESWVKARLGIAPQVDLKSAPDQAATRGRALVACLAMDHGLCSAATVARHFGRARSTLSEQMTACRSHAADHQILGTPANRIVAEGVALLNVISRPSGR